MRRVAVGYFMLLIFSLGRYAPLHAMRYMSLCDVTCFALHAAELRYLFIIYLYSIFYFVHPTLSHTEELYPLRTLHGHLSKDGCMSAGINNKLVSRSLSKVNLLYRHVAELTFLAEWRNAKRQFRHFRHYF